MTLCLCVIIGFFIDKDILNLFCWSTSESIVNIRMYSGVSENLELDKIE